MADAAWKPDPAGRHELRYFDGTAWSDYVSDLGVQTTDPFQTLADPEPTRIVDLDPAPMVDATVLPASAAKSRRWPWVAGIVGALVVGIGIGAAAQTSKVDDLKTQVKSVTSQRDVALAKVHDREAQRRANQAKAAAQRAAAARTLQKQKAAADKAAKEAADKAAADRAAQQKQVADALAAAQAQAAAMGTIESDGVYAIGTDKSPGRYHTDGAAGCYYAILNSPDTFDIATNNNVDGPAYVDLPAGKFFETTRCATWTKVA